MHKPSQPPLSIIIFLHVTFVVGIIEVACVVICLEWMAWNYLVFLPRPDREPLWSLCWSGDKTGSSRSSSSRKTDSKASQAQRASGPRDCWDLLRWSPEIVSNLFYVIPGCAFKSLTSVKKQVRRHERTLYGRNDMWKSAK